MTMKTMKKTYTTPAIEVVEVEYQCMLCEPSILIDEREKPEDENPDGMD